MATDWTTVDFNGAPLAPPSNTNPPAVSGSELCADHPKLYTVYGRRSATSPGLFDPRLGLWTAVNQTSLAHLGLLEIEFTEVPCDGTVLMSLEDANRVAEACPALEPGEYRVHTFEGGFDVELPEVPEVRPTGEPA